MRAAENRRLPFGGEGRREVAVEAPLQERTASDRKRSEWRRAQERGERHGVCGACESVRRGNRGGFIQI